MRWLAATQLAAWEDIAERWETETDGRVVRCKACGKSVRLLTDALGHMFLYTHVEVMALTVLHLRNFHQDLDPDC